MKLRPGPSGIHLFDRRTGLNALFDEIVVPEVLWASAPRFLSIALTNACDLSCSYCYAPKAAASLTFARLKEWLLEIDRNGSLGVGFGGGEPTLYPQFADACRFVSDYTGLAVSVTTHAHRLQHQLAVDLRGSVNFVRVSMDGVGLTYERLRGRPFTDLRRKLDIARSIAPFGINFVVNADTFPTIDEAIAVSIDAGAREFLLLPQRQTSRAPSIDVGTTNDLRGWVERYRGSLPLVISESGSESFPTCNPLAKEADLLAYAHLSADGNVKRSSYADFGVAIDNNGVLHALNLLSTSLGE